jgi:uncharacterized SAM-binding protein YcdF (DUF218 family)
VRRLFKFTLLLLSIPLLYVAWNFFDVWQTSKRDERPKSDAIVVMGAAQYNGRPSPVFRRRLDHARALYDDHVAPLIVVLGGKREGDRFTEAEAGAAYLEKELPADKVTGVKGGSTTLDSLRRFTGLAEMRKIKKIVIVSDPPHLARSETMAEDFGFEASVSGTTVSQTAEQKREALLRESAHLAYYRIFKKD